MANSLREESDTVAGEGAIGLRTLALAAVAEALSDDTGGSADSPEIAFLQQHQRSLGDRPWQDRLIAYLNAPERVDQPLIELSRKLGMHPIEVLSVALAVAVEEEMMAGRALAFVQKPVGGSRPTLGLLSWVFGAGQQPLETLLSGAAIHSGLLTISDDGLPLPERTIGIPLNLYLALTGKDGRWPGATIGLGSTPAVPLPPSILETAEFQVRALQVDAERALVLRTGSTAEGKSVGAAIAKRFGLRPVFIEAEETAGLTPWLLLRRLLPVFCFEIGPNESKRLPELPFYDGPRLALCGPDGTVQTSAGVPHSWTISVAPRDQRRELWRIALDGQAEDGLAEELAGKHRHGSGRIAQLGRLARRQSVLEGTQKVEARHILAAGWSGEGDGLDGLAQPLTEPIPDEALVLGPVVHRSLQSLLMRCRARDGLVDGLGASAIARYRCGVRSLFVGPSGTGKTLAAAWIATQLSLPLYRVDLASVTSKYIGETEKNLSQLLARAEQAEVVLLFDEADSLFGKRTDVQQANDRFANAQTNYLLQRIETYDGITILTSNSRTRFDSAFSRRLDAIIEFPVPGPAERRQLWRSHLGRRHELTDAQLNRLAATADLTGGEIRNVVLAAAVLVGTADRAIRFADLVDGLRSEFRKLGRQVPVELND